MIHFEIAAPAPKPEPDPTIKSWLELDEDTDLILWVQKDGGDPVRLLWLNSDTGKLNRFYIGDSPDLLDIFQVDAESRIAIEDIED